jgi:MFS family permease
MNRSVSARRARGTNALRQAFRAFSHRPFRLFFVGQGLSLVGTWMQSVAMSWLVYRLTGSALMLGVVGFASQFPAFLIAPFAGVLADRWSRHRMVLATQLASMAQATLLAALVLTGIAEVWHIIALAAVLGVVAGFDIPARQALLVELVEGPEDLANAIALNSSMFNAARLVGPAIAGIVIALTGEAPIFVLNALSYTAIIWALFAIGLPPRRPLQARRAILSQLGEGVRYVAGFAPLRAILTLLAVVSLVGMPYIVLLPVFATEVLGGGAETLGFLMSAAGAGALAGALHLAGRRSVRGLGRVIVRAGALFGAGLITFAFSPWTHLSVLLLFVTGYGMMVMTAACNTVLQTVSDNDKRGRVMSFYTMAFMGMAPFGSLVAGALASRVGAPVTVAAGGAACLVTAALFARSVPRLREAVRPVYERLGIIPEVATGLGTATELRPRN